MTTGPTINRHRSKQDYETPWEFIRAVEHRFGILRTDLAATQTNHKADFFVDVAQRDSFACNWHRMEGLLWLNPKLV